MIVVDVAKFLTSHYMQIEQIDKRIFILEWLIRRSSSFGEYVMNQVKNAMFFNWFIEDLKMEAIATTAIFMNTLLKSNSPMIVDFLSYLVKFRS